MGTSAVRTVRCMGVLIVQVGACLLTLAVGSLRVRVRPPDTGANGADGGGGGIVEEPAFTHTTSALMTFQRGSYQTPGMIACHPQVLRMLEGDEEVRARGRAQRTERRRGAARAGWLVMSSSYRTVPCRVVFRSRRDAAHLLDTVYRPAGPATQCGSQFPLLLLSPLLLQLLLLSMLLLPMLLC